jgi:transposase InsO family protein
MRLQFIALYQQDIMSFTDLCKHFGVSRTTGYKFVDRYKELGPAGLADQSKAPYSHPNSTPESIQDQIIDFRKDHPNWGPKKLLTVLLRDYPDINWPAASTIGELLKNKNLVKSRRKHGHLGSITLNDLTIPNDSNEVWTADFKGQFKLQNNSLCYPLTICDNFTKMILACSGLSNTATDPAKAIWVAAFRQYGLPRVIRTDNGVPFASNSIGSISKLSAWWIRLGIIPERISPGNPQQNGSHERMHKTLKQEVASKPKANLKSQQKAFNDFVYEYNYIRPHEALGQQVPASIYKISKVEYPLILPKLEYPSDFTVRHVRTNGEIRWRGELLFVSEVLKGEYVGLEQLDDRQWALYYGQVPLAILDSYKKSWLSSKLAAPIIKQLKKESIDIMQNC